MFTKVLRARTIVQKKLRIIVPKIESKSNYLKQDLLMVNAIHRASLLKLEGAE